MSSSDLEKKLRAALTERNQKAIREAFEEFERRGGLQTEASEIGEKLHMEIRDTDEELHDMLLDVLDFVVGWSSPHNRIWKE